MAVSKAATYIQAAPSCCSRPENWTPGVCHNRNGEEEQGQGREEQEQEPGLDLEHEADFESHIQHRLAKLGLSGEHYFDTLLVCLLVTEIDTGPSVILKQWLEQ